MSIRYYVINVGADQRVRPDVAPKTIEYPISNKEYPMSKERKYDLQETDEQVAILFTSIETAKKKKRK